MPIPVLDNPDAHRFEATVDGQVGVLTYRKTGDHITLLHTEVPPALRGHGLANLLAQHALERARAEGWKVIVYCPFVQVYLKRHPEYGDLVVPAPR